MNIKVIIFAVAALLVGLGGGTAAVVLTAPKHAASDSSHAAADSLGEMPKDAARHSVEHALAAGSDSARDHVETIMAPTGDATGQVAAAPHGPQPVAPVTAPGAKPAPPNTHAAALGDDKSHVVGASMASTPGANMTGIFSNMKPAEAARILALLSDDQAADILRQFEPRQAAGILTQLPADRAAAVSRRLLLSHMVSGNTK